MLELQGIEKSYKIGETSRKVLKGLDIYNEEKKDPVEALRSE